MIIMDQEEVKLLRQEPITTENNTCPFLKTSKKMTSLEAPVVERTAYSTQDTQPPRTGTAQASLKEWRAKEQSLIGPQVSEAVEIER